MAQPLRRRPVAQDQVSDRALELGAFEWFRDGLERLVRQARAAARLGEQVPGPGGVVAPGRDQQAPVRLLDVSDRDVDRSSARSSPRLQPDDLAPAGQLLAELVRQRPPRCQDLPSVWTEGA